MEYIKKVDLLNKAVEVEYLGRPRLMVSVAQIGLMPAIDIVRCKECQYKDMDICAMHRLYVAGVRKADDFCSYGKPKGEE